MSACVCMSVCMSAVCVFVGCCLATKTLIELNPLGMAVILRYS